MQLKSLLITAAAAAALAATGAVAQEEHREVVIQHGDGPPMHCEIHMHMGPPDAMKGMDPHGVVTREQFLAMHAKMFDELDLNHDGKLEPDEMEKAHHAMMETHGDCDPEMMRHMHEMHGMGGMEEGDMHGKHEIAIHMIHDLHDFDRLDVNKDGKVTFEEFAAPLRKAFDAIDSKHQGFIDRDEWNGMGHMEIREEHHDGDEH
jgi:hypothetical protein